MVQIMDGKEVAKSIIHEIEAEVAGLTEIPRLDVILVGEDPAAQAYFRNIERTSRRVGIETVCHQAPADITQKDLEELIGKVSDNEIVHGILVQNPLPRNIDKYTAQDQIDPLKDVDGLTGINITRSWRRKYCLEPCTPTAVLAILEHYKISLEGKHVVVVGRGERVGKPLYDMMGNRHATVTLCHSRTNGIAQHVRMCDILVSAAGRPEYITGNMVRDGTVVIDVGFNNVGDRVVGDVDYNEVAQRASHITPVPGGVGPVTVACLIQNLLKAYKFQRMSG